MKSELAMRLFGFVMGVVIGGAPVAGIYIGHSMANTKHAPLDDVPMRWEVWNGVSGHEWIEWP